MFRVDRPSNEIQPLLSKTFSELGFRERSHLQEWIKKYPLCLGEELLIIQKEFAGFSDTSERLDLLALDKDGRLVIIENKLDDTGRDVTWQALKYASYCASLTRDNVRAIYQEYLLKEGLPGQADELISEFLGVEEFSDVVLNKGFSQRIILIAASFRKEVTSTVLWLMNFKLQVQCFKVTPWMLDSEIFLNVEQIIPTRDAQEFVIGLADKAQDEASVTAGDVARKALFREFWSNVLAAIQRQTTLYDNISAGGYSWIGAGSGLRGVGFNFSVSRSYARSEVYIDRGDQKENKWIFEKLYERKNTIDQEFGGTLDWEKLENKRACRIKAEINANVNEREDWPEMISFMVDSMVRIEKAFKAPLEEISRELSLRREEM